LPAGRGTVKLSFGAMKLKSLAQNLNSEA
jgi:hypothetical protein